MAVAALREQLEDMAEKQGERRAEIIELGAVVEGELEQERDAALEVIRRQASADADQEERNVREAGVELPPFTCLATHYPANSGPAGQAAGKCPTCTCTCACACTCGAQRAEFEASAWR